MNAVVDDLPVGYYRDNVAFLFEFVLQRYADLLTPVERAYGEQFFQLSLSAQRFYVRLALRKGPLFRSDKLQYAEIDDIAAAAAELIEAGYLAQGEDAPFDAFLSLLVKAELSRFRKVVHAEAIHLKSMPLANVSREALTDDLQLNSSVAALRDFVDVEIGCQVYQPLQLPILQTFRLLFFGNLHQDFTEFVLNDLGILPYEDYAIDQHTRFFDRRELLDQAEMLALLRDQAETLIEAGSASELQAFARALPPQVASELQRRLDKVNNRVARQLERYGDTKAALQLYARTTSGMARERRVRLLAADPAQWSAALDLCAQMLSAPENESEVDFAASFATRLYRKVEVRQSTSPQSTSPLTAHHSPAYFAVRAKPKPDCVLRELRVAQIAGRRVELLAADHFEALGGRAFYVENSLLPSIFGLAYWDIIYAPVRGAFFNPFQRGPADLYTGDFCLQRRVALQDRLLELTHIEALQQRVLDTLRLKVGRVNPFVHWGALSLELLDSCFARIPITHFHAVFQRLLADPRANRSGFPDLIVFPAAGGYLLAEVKGPNDKLQTNQTRWLRYFNECDIPHEVVNVSWL
ncbi:MAG: hypothetical protein ACI9SB_002126 [Candidatus Azotimanducaceae bacterium]